MREITPAAVARYGGKTKLVVPPAGHKVIDHQAPATDLGRVERPHHGRDGLPEHETGVVHQEFDRNVLPDRGGLVHLERDGSGWRAAPAERVASLELALLTPSSSTTVRVTTHSPAAAYVGK